MEIKEEWIGAARLAYWREDGDVRFETRFRAALAAVAPLIAGAEREAIARDLEASAGVIEKHDLGGIAAAIRARGQS
jgi:hypothetical protein